MKRKIEERIIEGMYLVESLSKSEVAILFIHGLGESSLCWMEAFSELLSDWHLLAIDLPGYGRSPRGDFDGKLNGYVLCLENLINEYLTSALSLWVIPLAGTSGISFQKKVSGLLLLSVSKETLLPMIYSYLNVR